MKIDLDNKEDLKKKPVYIYNLIDFSIFYLQKVVCLSFNFPSNQKRSKL